MTREPLAKAFLLERTYVLLNSNAVTASKIAAKTANFNGNDF